MKIQLLTTIPSLGRSGDIIDVSDAQARNQLLPKKLAVAATGHVVAAQRKHLQDVEAQRQQHQKNISVLIERLTGATVPLSGKASGQGKLFAAIKSNDIVAAIEHLHHIHLPHARCLPDHLKTLGQHQVTLMLDDQHRLPITISIEHGT